VYLVYIYTLEEVYHRDCLEYTSKSGRLDQREFLALPYTLWANHKGKYRIMYTYTPEKLYLVYLITHIGSCVVRGK
jgi:hypothetical protein